MKFDLLNDIFEKETFEKIKILKVSNGIKILINICRN
jgi:hypothetical protein